CSVDILPDMTSYKHPDIFTMIDGVRSLPGLSSTWFGYLKTLPVKADRDVFIVSYPKSGTSWTSEIMWQIYHEGKIDYNSIHNRVPYTESTPLEHNLDTNEKLVEFFLNHPQPRIFKFHLPYHQVPMGDDADDKPKYIYVLRNPKDVAVSFYYHYKGFKIFGFADRTWDEFFEMFINDQGKATTTTTDY
ncbi:Sulfotransferase 1 family member D1, partial [Exaiptasia diaphana]